MRYPSLIFMFEVSVLASGSSGNSFYIGTNRGDLLIDAGISCRQITNRLNSIGKNIEDIKKEKLKAESVI